MSLSNLRFSQRSSFIRILNIPPVRDTFVNHSVRKNCLKFKCNTDSRLFLREREIETERKRKRVRWRIGALVGPHMCWLRTLQSRDSIMSACARFVIVITEICISSDESLRPRLCFVSWQAHLSCTAVIVDARYHRTGALHGNHLAMHEIHRSRKRQEPTALYVLIYATCETLSCVIITANRW